MEEVWEGKELDSRYAPHVDSDTNTSAYQSAQPQNFCLIQSRSQPNPLLISR